MGNVTDGNLSVKYVSKNDPFWWKFINARPLKLNLRLISKKYMTSNDPSNGSVSDNFLAEMITFGENWSTWPLMTLNDLPNDICGYFSIKWPRDGHKTFGFWQSSQNSFSKYFVNCTIGLKRPRETSFYLELTSWSPWIIYFQ